VLLDQPTVLPCRSPAALCILDIKLQSAVYTICCANKAVGGLDAVAA